MAQMIFQEISEIVNFTVHGSSVNYHSPSLSGKSFSDLRKCYSRYILSTNNPLDSTELRLGVLLAHICSNDYTFNIS